jgi:hypothetical protein
MTTTPKDAWIYNCKICATNSKRVDEVGRLLDHNHHDQIGDVPAICRKLFIGVNSLLYIHTIHN